MQYYSLYLCQWLPYSTNLASSKFWLIWFGNCWVWKILVFQLVSFQFHTIHTLRTQNCPLATISGCSKYFVSTVFFIIPSISPFSWFLLVNFSRQRSNALNSISHVSRTGSLLGPTSSIISVQIIPRVPERLQATVLQLDLDPIGAPASPCTQTCVPSTASVLRIVHGIPTHIYKREMCFLAMWR